MQDSDELPYAYKDPPTDRYAWDFPTAWLLGTQLVGALGDIAISSVFDFDPRDWMSPGEPILLDDPALQEADGSLWIDFLADSGDSPRLVYQLAYLLQQPSLEVRVKEGDQHFCLDQPLPRGRALIFGGDTSYPIASRRRLLERIRAPFIWARQELARRGLLSQLNVTLLGIPGNHDYYNALAGFERQFHDRGDCAETAPADRVTLTGYTLMQRSSYFAAVLPHGWQLWALDCEKRGVDKLQAAYFAKAAQRDGFDGKRIVATSRPTVVNHALNHAIRTTRTQDPKSTNMDLADCFDAVGLSRAFQQGGQLPADNPRDRVRLDLSGDVHLYERYWGVDAATKLGPVRPLPEYIQREFPATDEWPPKGTRPPTGNEDMPHTAGTPRTNYASVVTGLGGAFHHPSQVRGKPAGDRAIVPRRAWPGGGESDRQIGQRLLRPRKVFQAGAVGVIGMLVTFLTYSTRQGHLLDLPFNLHGCSRALLQLGIVGAIIGTLIGLGLLTAGAFWLAKRLHRQVQDLGPPRNPWGRFTHWVTHHWSIAWCLRWFGINRRNAWGTLITFWAWAPAVALWVAGIYALWRCTYLVHAADDNFVSTYVTLGILVLFLGILGSVKLGGRNGALGYLLGAVLGVLTAALVVWTPYAWARLVMSSHWYGAFAFFGYWPVRHLFLGPKFHTLGTNARRFFTLLAYVFVIALYTVVPFVFLRNDIACIGEWDWGYPIAIALSAYLSCLWLGWYFFIALQWNAHGNEAGGAARVVSFAEFLRIKLTKDQAEVFVIGVEGPSAPERSVFRPCSRRAMPEQPPIARLIDHFVVGVKRE